MLTKIHIQNYRVFESFNLEFSDGLNILVGNNDVGKSTLLEAVNLALTARVRGRLFATELSPHHFNRAATRRYLDGLVRGQPAPPPEITYAHGCGSVPRLRPRRTIVAAACNRAVWLCESTMRAT